MLTTEISVPVFGVNDKFRQTDSSNNSDRRDFETDEITIRLTMFALTGSTTNVVAFALEKKNCFRQSC